jgi:hypothetical protein
VTRKSFLLFWPWAVCLIASVFISALVRALLDKDTWLQAVKNPFKSLQLDPNRGFGRNHRARSQRQLRTRRDIEKARGFVREINSGLVHWVQPKAYKLRLGSISGKTENVAKESLLRELAMFRELDCANFKDIASLRNTRNLVSQTSTANQPYLDPKRSANIRENLALASLSMQDPKNPNDSIVGVQQAKQIILPLLKSSLQHCNWRIFEFYARLCCIDSQNKDAQAALKNIQSDMPKWPKTELPERMLWLADPKDFARFYAKSNDTKNATFRRRLQSRITHAKLLLEGDSSSSGKDSAHRTEGGPNPPLSPSSYKSHLRGETEASLRGTRSESPSKRKKKCKLCVVVKKDPA